MALNKNQLRSMLRLDGFERSTHYDLEWMLANEMGPNAIWLAEFLSQGMSLQPGMRVLDMGCGTAMTSIFLAKEFGVQVWANDLWISATDNFRRIMEAGVDNLVYPIHAEAHALPYAEGFFDAVISVDSYHYYGTDDAYLPCFARLLKPGGQIGIVVPGLLAELDGEVPAYLKPFWEPDFWTFHSVAWWRRHWQQTNLVEIEIADNLPEGWAIWKKWEDVMRAAEANKPGREGDLELLTADNGRNLCFVRLVARKLKT